MSLNITTTATVPSGDTLKLTVFEDTDGDGIPDNRETQTISDGTNTYTYSTLNGGSGNVVWWQPEVYSTDATTAATIDSVEITGGVQIKYYDGSSWVTKTLQYEDNGFTDPSALKRWDGSQWVNVG